MISNRGLRNSGQTPTEPKDSQHFSSEWPLFGDVSLRLTGKARPGAYD